MNTSPERRESGMTLAQKYEGVEMAIDPQSMTRIWQDTRPGVTVQMSGSHAVVQVRGVLSYDPDHWMGEVGYGAVSEAARQVSEDARCRSCDLHIESPGGTVLGGQGACDTWNNVAKKKRVRVFVAHQATSMAYMLACAAAAPARSLHSSGEAVVGSVATLLTRVDRSKMLSEAGINIRMYSGGSKKAWGHSALPLSEEEDKANQARAEASTKAFQAQIAAYGYGSVEFWAGQQGASLPATTSGVVDVITSSLKGKKMEVTEEMAALQKQLAEIASTQKATNEALAAAQAELAQERAQTKVKELQLAGRVAAGEEALKAIAQVVVAVGTDWTKHLVAATPASQTSPEKSADQTRPTPSTPPAPSEGGRKDLTREELRARLEKGDSSFLDDPDC